MEKQSRGKTETRSGRRLQEERCFQEEQVSATETCTSFLGWWANSRAWLLLAG